MTAPRLDMANALTIALQRTRALLFIPVGVAVVAGLAAPLWTAY